jgi:hypothetical protein
MERHRSNNMIEDLKTWSSHHAIRSNPNRWGGNTNKDAVAADTHQNVSDAEEDDNLSSFHGNSTRNNIMEQDCTDRPSDSILLHNHHTNLPMTFSTTTTTTTTMLHHGCPTHPNSSSGSTNNNNNNKKYKLGVTGRAIALAAGRRRSNFHGSTTSRSTPITTSITSIGSSPTTTDGGGVVVGDADDTVATLAEKEQVAVCWSRVVTILVLVAAAVTMATTMHSLITRSEQADFETQVRVCFSVFCACLCVSGSDEKKVYN